MQLYIITRICLNEQVEVIRINAQKEVAIFCWLFLHKRCWLYLRFYDIITNDM